MASVSAPLFASPLNHTFKRPSLNLAMASQLPPLNPRHPNLKRPRLDNSAQESPAKRLRAMGEARKYINPIKVVPMNQVPILPNVRRLNQSIKLDLQFVPATQATALDEARRRQVTPEQAPAQPAVKPAAEFMASSKQFGLVNEDGTKCYRNSVFQVLLHQPEVVAWFEDHHKPESCAVRRCVACQIRRLVRCYWQQDRSAYASVDVAIRATHGLIERLGWKPNERGRQHDAQEYLTWVIQTMTSQLPPNQASHFTDVSSIKFKRSIICNHCRDTSSTIVQESFFFLPLLPRARNLEGFIREATHQQIDDRKCGKCHKLGARQETTILNAPPILCCHLMRASVRYNHSRGVVVSKDKYKVKYQKSLDLTSYLEGTQAQRGLYDLTAVVVHLGESVSSGHYVAELKIGGSWHTFSDKSVRASLEHRALDPSPGTSYLLFYRLR